MMTLLLTSYRLAAHPCAALALSWGKGDARVSLLPAQGRGRLIAWWRTVRAFSDEAGGVQARPAAGLSAAR
jgi:hypothetical protein